MEDGTSLLDPAVVAPPDDPAVDDQHRADGDAALGEPALGLVDGRLHEGVAVRGVHNDAPRVRTGRGGGRLDGLITGIEEIGGIADDTDTSGRYSGRPDRSGVPGLMITPGRRSSDKGVLRPGRPRLHFRRPINCFLIY